eukprot:6414311-Pyramimonas_sp.AAC.1
MAASASGGRSPMASRASVLATASAPSSSCLRGAQCSQRPPPGPAPSTAGETAKLTFEVVGHTAVEFCCAVEL